MSEPRPLRDWFLPLGALSAFVAVALGAFAAHALRTRIEPHLLEVFHTASDYQFWHALALVGLGLYARNRALTRGFRIAGWCFVVGSLVFSGSLYLLVLLSQPALGAITPIGGTLFLLGWATLAGAAWRAPT